MMRVGIGYDVHALCNDRPLIIGGVAIPYPKGLLGHSDADVLIHAVMDAMLGAAALGDIGQHFPDSDPKYKDISSLILLKEVAALLYKKGYACHNLDCTIVAQEPKLAPYIAVMKGNLAEILALGLDHVNVKATTTEGLGFAGRKEGIAAYAVCTIQSVSSRTNRPSSAQVQLNQQVGKFHSETPTLACKRGITDAKFLIGSTNYQ